MRLLENENFRCGLGTKLSFSCTNVKCTTNQEFFTTPMFDDKKTYKINTTSVLGMRSIGKGRAAALKLFSIMNLGSPVSQVTWTKLTILFI